VTAAGTTTGISTGTTDGTTDLAIYIHWPFCERVCPYCDFNVRTAEEVDQVRWRDAFLREAAHFAAEFPDRTISSIFFGGGTPSLMEADTVAGIISGIRELWAVSESLEISIESNVSPAEVKKFEAFGHAGVTRLSLGVQSLDNDALKFLGREHSAADAIAALDHGKEVFPMVSIDLIYARPGQLVQAWQDELAQALELGPDHLSLYQLTIEPGTPFAEKKIEPAEEDLAAPLYETTNTVLEAAGLPAYEVSNHARPGHQCHHNLTYWQGGDYVGLGPGAHGRLTQGQTDALYQIHTPSRWLDAVESRNHGTARRTALTEIERREELIMLGLRRSEGIDAERFFKLTGRSLEAALNKNKVDELLQGGFVVVDQIGLRTTPAGRQRLNAILGHLLT
jgi:putative oxygen-independent coproporphyrinogen III oxidase